MIETFFGFSSMPFSKSIPVEDIYSSPGLEEVISRLNYTAEKQFFSILTANVGCGKTTAVRKFAASLDKSKYELFYMSDSQLTPRWFYKGLLEQLGVEAKFYRNEARLQLHKELQLVRSVQSRNVVTVIDEAHLLDREMMEEIRFLLNYRMDSMNPMALILVGQNELLDKLKYSCYAAIKQRIDLKCSLQQFDRSQVGDYVTKHLQYVGCSAQLFSDSALDLIFNSSSGSARSINKICSHCLLFAAQRAKKIIDDHMVKQVIDGEML